LVLRIHLKSKEKDIFDFFAKSNIGRLMDIKIIRDQRSGRSKGVCYVEFENQESVLLAVTLTGQQILGQSIIIQSSQAEKNRSAAAAKYKKEMIREQQNQNKIKSDSFEPDGPMRIYVGGLVEQLDNMTDNDLRQLFPFGEIDYIDIDKDESTGKCRGYAYIQFRKASDARLAIKEMNGFNYNGRILKVGESSSSTNNGRVQFMNSDDLSEDPNLIHNLQTRQKLTQKLDRGGNIPALVSGTGFTGMTPSHNLYSNSSGMTQRPSMTPFNYSGNPNPQNQPVIQSNCLLLSNLFDPMGVNLKDEPEFFIDTEEDVKTECSNYGRVEKIWVDQNSKEGNVFVKFENKNYEATMKAFEKLNGRFFGGKEIMAKIIPENLFDSSVIKQ